MQSKLEEAKIAITNISESAYEDLVKKTNSLWQ